MLRECIGNGEIDRAITALKCIVIDKDFADKALLVQSQYSAHKRASIEDTEEHRTVSVERNRITKSLSSIIDEIPPDIDILKNIINYRLSLGANIINIVNTILGLQEYPDKYLIWLKDSLLTSQDKILSDINTESDESSLNQLNDFRLQLKNYLHSELELHKFKPQIGLLIWNRLLNDRNFHFTYIREVSISQQSPYFEDILGRDEKSKPLLMLWEEMYITGNYESALNYVNQLRIDKGFADQLIYEYTALAYLNKETPEKIINEAVTKKERIKYEKLKLYLLRSVKPSKKSTTINSSLEYIIQQLNISINKTYSNIAYDYILQSGIRGYSKRREITKKLIQLTIEISETFKFIEYDNSSLVASLILELDGGGKFMWLKCANKKVVNHTTFDAIEKRKFLLSCYRQGNSIIELKDNLYEALIYRTQKAVKDFQKDKLIYASEIAYLLYEDERFIKIQESTANRTGNLEEQNLLKKFIQKEELIDNDEDMSDSDSFNEAVRQIKERCKELKSAPASDNGINSNGYNNILDTTNVANDINVNKTSNNNRWIKASFGLSWILLIEIFIFIFIIAKC